MIKNIQYFSKFTKKYFTNTISLNLEFFRDDSEVSDTDILIIGKFFFPIFNNFKVVVCQDLVLPVL